MLNKSYKFDVQGHGQPCPGRPVYMQLCKPVDTAIPLCRVVNDRLQDHGGCLQAVVSGWACLPFTALQAQQVT